jgi:hypothetical protein
VKVKLTPMKVDSLEMLGAQESTSLQKKRTQKSVESAGHWRTPSKLGMLLDRKFKDRIGVLVIWVHFKNSGAGFF